MQWDTSLINDISPLITNPWLSLSFNLIGILSFLTSVYFYYISKKEKRPLFTKISKPVQVIDNENNVYNLTSTHICFWNSGREPIKKDDIAPKDPLTIRVKNNAQIINVEVRTPKYWSNGFDCDFSKNSPFSIITFDYIDKNQGAIFDILHTGISSEDIELTGSIIGFGNPIFINSNDLTTKQIKIKENYRALIFLLCLMIMYTYSMKDTFSALTKISIPIQFFTSLTFFTISIFIIISLKFRGPAIPKRLPFELRRLFDEI